MLIILPIYCSLVNAMCHGTYTFWGDPSHKITDGIDITIWDVGENNDKVTFSVWDFAGQSVYYNTHQVCGHHLSRFSTSK